MAELMMIAGGALAAQGALAKGHSQQQASNYNRDLNLVNARQAEQATDFAIQQDISRTDRLLGLQRAQIAKSGIDISGSPLLVMEETARDASINQQLMRYNGNQAVGAYQSEAYNNRRQGKAAMKAGVLNAGTSLLTGLSGMDGMTTTPFFGNGLQTGRASSD
jgi:hypothetical protein